jgi:uncharacterized protein with ParB-like and HNH nuclease domain/predicted transport protein
MKANESKLLALMHKTVQFMVPIYQRKYSWGASECRQLWNDIIRTGKDDAISAHFIGSIVYIQKDLSSTTTYQSPLLVIDGQQRLTTITLLLLALIRTLGSLPEEENEPIEGFSKEKLNQYYLINPLERGNRRYKLLLSETDAETVHCLIDDIELPENYSLRVKENFEYLTGLVQKSPNDLVAIWKGINKLLVVDVALTEGVDNPQLIFESMNSTGKELTQADLIRNYVLMQQTAEEQAFLYKRHWQAMERDFGQSAYSEEFDEFMRHYLTVKTGNIPKLGAVYSAFKPYFVEQTIERSVDDVLGDIRIFSSFYCAMKLNKEEDPKMREAFEDLKELKVDVAFPMLLELYNDYYIGKLAKDDFFKIVRLIESYVFRRYVCSIPTNSLNKTFAVFMRSVDKERYLESVQAQFQLLKSYRRFPDDVEFKRDLQTRDLYNTTRKNYWLRRFENYNRKERVNIEEYTIEHILPQNLQLSNDWQRDLGSEWKHIQEKWLHTLGNLTLTGYNSEYSDKPFKKKRDMENGFKDSPINLNKTLRSIEVWNEQAIIQRAEILSDLATNVWVSPRLSSDVLDGYQPKPLEKNVYSIEQFGVLAPGNTSFSAHVRKLFDLLREKILNIDPIVKEEPLSLYIAYKAETNFVDIMPLSTELKLILNMKYSEIYDPKRMSKDITGLRRRGNGDVEVRLSSETDLPYVLGLIRQSCEKQIGNGNYSGDLE